MLREAAVLPAQVALVSLSTTLANQCPRRRAGGRVGLVMVGFAPEDLARDGLADALGRDPVVFLKGGHDVHGTETPLEPRASRPSLPAGGLLRLCSRRLFRHAQSRA